MNMCEQRKRQEEKVSLTSIIIYHFLKKFVKYRKIHNSPPSNIPVNTLVYYLQHLFLCTGYSFENCDPFALNFCDVIYLKYVQFMTCSFKTLTEMAIK